MTTFQFTPAMLAQHLAIVGRTGSGKSYTAKGAVETLLSAQRRVCILDPTGIWYGLRSSADGKHAGWPVVVFGGPHADVPIAEQSGAALAHIVASKNLPAIIDLSEMLIGQRHRFATDFAEALYRENRAPLHLVIDEADEFCPQNPLPETKRMLHHIDRIVRRGRVRGFRVMLITQRPAVLHKNVLTQANVLIAMRLTGPQDRMALKAWVDGQADAAQGKAVIDSLARLQRGEGWVWAPEVDMLERVTFPRITTFDSGRAPEDDEVATVPTKLAAVDLSEITASFAAIEKEATTVAELKAELAKLRKSHGGATAAPVGHTDAQVQALIVAAVGREREASQRELEKLTVPLANIRDLVMGALGEGFDAMTREAADGPAVAASAASRPATATAKPPTPAPAPVRAATARKLAPPPSSDLSASEQRVVDAIAWWAAAGVIHPTRHQVAFVANYTVNGHFNNLAGTLRAKELVAYPGGGTLALTNSGAGAARAPQSRPTRDELIERVNAVLKGEPLRRVFGVLVQRGEPVARAALAEAAGYTENDHFNNIVGSLNGIGVCEYPSKGFVGLSSIFKDLQ